jgi:hypothetical protein
MNKFTLFCAAAAIVAPAAAYAQETTSVIRGDVTAGGAPVSGAEVVITHVPSGTTSRSTTDADGSFNASGLRVGGPYTLAVTAAGHEPVSITDIQLTAGEPFRVPVELTVLGEEIVVTGTRGAREQSQGPITTLTREDIEGVASVSRDIRDIARRDPFATMDLSNSRTIEIAGQNGRLNRFSVDGVQFSDDFGLNLGGLPTSRGPVPFDAIEQFSVKVAPYDVSEGDFQGGAINVVLRSGGNRFGGSIFGNYSDDSLTGTRVRGQDVDLEFESKTYGGLISGPIIKDRLFFMFAYEKLEESDPFDDGVGPGFSNQVPGVTLQNIADVSQIAQTTYNYDTLGQGSTAVEEDEKMIAKLDWNISDNHRAAFTYIRNVGTQQFRRNTFLTPPASLGLVSSGYELGEEVNSGVFQLNSDWSDGFSTELRASYRDYNRDQIPFGGTDFAQIEVCLDPTSVGSATSCGGSRIFFGPDISRHSNDLDTSNLAVDFTARKQIGDHNLKFVLGYNDNKVFNLFLESSLGNIYFDSIADFQARRANRLRLAGAVPSLDPNDAAATFSAQSYTVGFQDDWDISETLQVTAGVRWDLYGSGDRPPLNPNFLTRHGFANTHTFNGRDVIQPRIGFNWNPADRLIIRGGVGVFAGGTPDVFLSNSFSNTGQLTNFIDINRANCAASNTCAGLNDVTGRAYPPTVLNFLATNTASLAAAPVNAIDPDLDVSSQMRATLSVNYEAALGPLGDGWLLGADALYGEVIDAYTWTDLRSVRIGTLPDGRPRYGPLGGVLTNNQDLVMTNDNRGRSMIGVLRLSKEWDMGLGIDASYTRSNVKDANAMTSTTAGSLYSNNAVLDPNFAAYGRSIYEIKNQWKMGIDYKKAFFGDNFTRFSLFGEYRSGRPYSITMLDRTSGRLPVLGTVGNGGRGLLYVPMANDPKVSFDTALSETKFNDLVTRFGLDKYRGQILPKNSHTSPDFFKVDLRVTQDIPVFGLGKIKLFGDLENVLNFLDSDWGALRQVAFPQTASVVDVQCLSAATPTGTNPGTGVVNTLPTQNCAQYRYSAVVDPILTTVSRQSLYQFRVGVRFEF